jgi:RNA polymerase sigma factor (sigma-70 family)
MRDRDFLAERFEQERPQLRRIAYRMLGTVEDADDAVQESWIRLSRTDESAVENLGAWLTTVVSRVSLDILRARRSRHEEYVGSWMPEPIVSIDDRRSPEDEALIADGVGLALYVVLETLSPAERLAFVLHDMFAVPFDEIAAIAGRSSRAALVAVCRVRDPSRMPGSWSSSGSSTPSSPPHGTGTSKRSWKSSTRRSHCASTPVRAESSRGRRSSVAKP